MSIEAEVRELAAAIVDWPKVERHAQPLSDASQNSNVANVCDARGLRYDSQSVVPKLKDNSERSNCFD